MHPNPIFGKTDVARSLDFVRTRGFGALMINGPDRPLVAHVPFLLNDAGTGIEAHLMRSNPVWRALNPAVPAVLAVTGPDGYVSPDWYGAPDQVPTWNYVAVHLSGSLERVPDSDLPGVLDRLSAHFEAGLAPKRPWTADKMSDGVMARMMRSIVPVRLTVQDVRSTWKLGQNKPAEVRQSAANQVETGTGSELAALAALMHDPPQPSKE